MPSRAPGPLGNKLTLACVPPSPTPPRSPILSSPLTLLYPPPPPLHFLYPLPLTFTSSPSPPHLLYPPPPLHPRSPLRLTWTLPSPVLIGETVTINLPGFNRQANLSNHQPQVQPEPNHTHTPYCYTHFLSFITTLGTATAIQTLVITHPLIHNNSSHYTLSQYTYRITHPYS